ncbi:TonB-dependent receptor [Alteromonas sp. BMJM2]|uniref:TonB-dependent receptor n=1 Tax=Alteromonas sp. BMJM2 TaxID=2954241 RepID=UPI0022B48E39|nr:TonB-dependent receptor [Alteromonas sp. BMJM2]
MRKLSKVALIVCSSLCATATAQTIQGQVTNKKGLPVAGALIELEGSGLEVTTDENGKFVIEDASKGVKELHIRASDYAHLHKDITVSSDDSTEVSFVLERSPIEVIDVYASPIHLSSMESAIPVNVLGGDSLRREQAATLGDTLEQLPGVHTNFHAKVASTPIIRGLSGPRVLIAQNGLDVSDVSRVGPDHSVASEASTAQQIEVLRGPATLFYGSGAIGGVVNVVDKRVPTSTDTQGEWLVQHSSVDDQNLASFNATTGTGNVAFYADGFFRDANDYEVPVNPELEHDDHDEDHDEEHDSANTVANSSEESSGFTLGTSYLLDNGYVGISVEKFNREYGIPGHSHGEEEHDDHDDEHNHDDEHDHGGESEHGDVFADLEQTKIQLLSELTFEDSILSKVNMRAGYTDYEHAEIEAGIAGTTFKNETYELRLDLMHQTFAGFNGGLSIHYKASDVEAQGSEAFTPPSETEMLALSLLEERHFGDVLLQFGGRIERVTLNADQVLLPTIDAHGHDDHSGDEDSHDHDHDAHDHDDHGHSDADITRAFYADHEFTPMSLSAGIVWDFTPGYNVGLSVSRSQRAPSASELLSFGPHIGTRTYEVGALFALEQHNGESEITLTDDVIDLETANNIDLTFRKTQGDVSFIANLFYNQIDNYYYQINTGLFADDGHNHDHTDEHEGHAHEMHASESEDDHSGELPVFLFQTDDVILHGFEAQIAWQVTDSFKASAFGDFVRARLENGGDLPRTPPLRFGTQLSYENEALSAHLDITRFQSQDRIADFETDTDGYTLVDLHVTYDLAIFDQDTSLFFRGENLTDTEARVHTSFLKDIAPRPGRNLTVGIQGYF